MQQNNNQEYSLNGLQLINPNMISSYSPYGYNFPGVLLNQQNGMINQSNLLLNQQNLILNQQANQFYQQNQLIPVAGQQMYFCNLNTPNRNQLPLSALVITPPNLLPSTLISPKVADNQKRLKSTKRSSKKNEMTKKSTSKKANKHQLEQQLQQLRQRQQINEESSDDDQEDSNIQARFQQMLLMNNDQEEENGSEYGPVEDDMSVELEENNQSENENYEQYSESDEDEDMVHSRKRPKSHASIANKSDSETEDRNDVLFDNQLSNNPTYSGCDYEQDESTSYSPTSHDNITDLRYFKREKSDSDNRNNNSNFDDLDPNEIKKKKAEVQNFARDFRIFRTTLNIPITQEVASKELSKFVKCSQSKICRFEKYFSNPKPLENNNKLKSALITMKILKDYMLLKQENINAFDNLEVKTRKKRANFQGDDLYALINFFQNNMYPSEEEIDELSKQTNHSRQEIKVWFNNKRQTLKKATK